MMFIVCSVVVAFSTIDSRHVLFENAWSMDMEYGCMVGVYLALAVVQHGVSHTHTHTHVRPVQASMA